MSSRKQVVGAECPEYRTAKRPTVTVNGEFPVHTPISEGGNANSNTVADPATEDTKPPVDPMYGFY